MTGLMHTTAVARALALRPYPPRNVVAHATLTRKHGRQTATVPVLADEAGHWTIEFPKGWDPGEGYVVIDDYRKSGLSFCGVTA